MHASFCRLMVFSACCLTLSSAVVAQTDDESDLAVQTRTVLKELSQLKNAAPIKIQAFVSPRAPAKYVSTIKLLRKTLAAIDRVGGDRIDVVVNEVEGYTASAAKAYIESNIHPYPVRGVIPGVLPGVYVYCGVIVSSGDQMIRLPFLSPGDLLEHRLVLALQQVSKLKMAKRRIGILTTGMSITGGFSATQFAATPRLLIVNELQQHYEVVSVGAAGLERAKIDMLLVAQISSLDADGLAKTIAWIRKGNPVLIFEDPLGAMTRVVGTAEPNRVGFSGVGRPQEPKPSLEPLWKTLGVKFSADSVVWQDHRPPGIRARVPKEMVFITRNTPSRFETIDRKHKITKSLNTLLFMYGGAIAAVDSKGLTFQPLAAVSDASGLRSTADARNNRNPKPYRKTRGAYFLAAEIEGTPPNAKDGEKVRVVLVADVDCIADPIVQVRDQPSEAIPIPLDNLAFLHNCIDSLIGDDAKIELRGRRPKLPPPSKRELNLAAALGAVESSAERAERKLRDDLEVGLAQQRRKMEQQPGKGTPASRAKLAAQLRIFQEAQQRAFQVKRAELINRRDRELARVRHDLRERLELLPTK